MNCEQLVTYFSRKTVCKCPSLDIDDVKQELFIASIEAQKEYDSSSEQEFNNYLDRRLKWQSLNIMRNHIRRLRAETLWANEQGQLIVQACESEYGTICQKVVKVLEQRSKECHGNRKKRYLQACKLFQLLACPDSIIEKDRKRPRILNITNAARYLGLGYNTKYRVLHEIQSAVQQVIYGQE
jgi:hypothetical protein